MPAGMCRGRPGPGMPGDGWLRSGGVTDGTREGRSRQRTLRRLSRSATTRGSAGALPSRQLRRRGQAALDRLLDAAEDVFGRKGYHESTVADIVAASGMARTTFYEYFATKEDLFRAVLADVAGQMRAHAASLEPIQPGPDAQDGLRAWLARFVALYAEHRSLLRVWTEAEVAGTDLGSLGREVLGEVAGRFADAVRSGRPATGRPRHAADPDIAALALVAMIERVNYYAAVGLLDVSDDELVDGLSAIVHGALIEGPVARRG